MSLSTSSSSPTMNSESSKSRNSASLSPQLSNDTNLGLDPSDPLNLWLHDTSQGSDSSMDDSSAGESPPDWSQLSTLWPPSGESGANGKMEGVDFSMTLGSDMDFVNSMVIDPNALHFNYDGISPNELLPGQHYPFTFQSDGPTTLNVNDLTLQRERKLSITSSSSSSGASFSPIISSPVVPGQLLNHLEPRLDDPAAELAQRVRQIAGVTLAVPMGAHIQQATSNGTMSPQHSIVSGSPMSSPSTLFTSPSQSFMSMQAPSPSAYPSSSSATSSAPSTPPPTTPPPSAQLAVNAPASISTQAQQPSMGVISRPKTSHTTIERRYRTNLNARITSLRMAVPALRVLEDKEGTGVGGGGKKGKNSTLGKAVQFGTKVKKENEDGSDVIDVIDERGFVDGVKVARKCSKANVLGKAVEYIRVLKKREMRLKREQDGLKQLISGLVGGPALLREWEREWRAKFGGEEKDEVEGEDMDDGASDDDSGEDEDDEDGGRKRKKPKISPPPKELKEKKPAPPPPQPTVLPDGTVIMPEKRKRGRPRKIQPIANPVVVPNPGEHTLNFQPNMAPQPIQSQQQQQPAPTQYLLAVFALFSFFNSPFTSSSSPAHAPPNHSHTGTVLTHDATPIQPIVHGWTWHEIIQAFHLLVSALVFCSIVLPWLPVPSTKYFSFSYLSSLSASYRERARSRSNSAALRTRSAALREALSKRGSVCEANELRNALGSDVGVVKSLKGLIGLGKKENFTYQQKGLEQSAWVRLGELCVLGGETDAINRALTFWHMRAHLPWFTSSAADLSTLALVLYPLARFARRPAKAIWDAARARKGYSGLQEGGVGVLIRPHERLVLETMNIDEAVKFLEENPAPSERARYSPIGVLAGTLVKRRIKSYLQKSFVKTVLSSEAACDLEDDSVPVVDVAKSVTEEEEEERQVRVTIDAARSLGGRFSEMGEMLENIWTMGTCELDASEENDDDEESLENEIQALFNALVLYRRIFSSSIMGPGNVSSVSILLSPPPSPSRHDNKLHMSLRRALGSSVFESDDTALEDARDRVVDMLVECERARR